MKRLIFAILAAAVTLAACGKPVPQSGYVRKRQYVPARDWTDLVPQYSRSCVGIPYTYTVSTGAGTRIATGARQSCTSTLTGYWPVHRHEDRYWRLLLKDDRDAANVQWRDVTEQEYDRYGIGQHYPDPR